MDDIDWQARVKGLLKAELKKRGVSYKQLAEMLRDLGVTENDRNIANKLARERHGRQLTGLGRR